MWDAPEKKELGGNDWEEKREPGRIRDRRHCTGDRAFRQGSYIRYKTEELLKAEDLPKTEESFKTEDSFKTEESFKMTE